MNSILFLSQTIYYEDNNNGNKKNKQQQKSVLCLCVCVCLWQSTNASNWTIIICNQYYEEHENITK